VGEDQLTSLFQVGPENTVWPPLLTRRPTKHMFCLVWVTIMHHQRHSLCPSCHWPLAEHSSVAASFPLRNLIYDHKFWSKLHFVWNHTDQFLSLWPILHIKFPFPNSERRKWYPRTHIARGAVRHRPNLTPTFKYLPRSIIHNDMGSLAELVGFYVLVDTFRRRGLPDNRLQRYWHPKKWNNRTQYTWNTQKHGKNLPQQRQT